MKCMYINIYTCIHTLSFSFSQYIYIYIYIHSLSLSLSLNIYIKSEVKLATIVEGEPKVPFSIATAPRCRGGRYSFLWIAPLYS